MSHSQILFFSEDEIEAVDMEIETLLLAKARQEDQQRKADTTVEAPQEKTRQSVASSLSPSPSKPIQAPLVAPAPSFPVSGITSPLPHKHLAKSDTGRAPASFRIDAGPDRDLWVEAEPSATPIKKQAKGKWTGMYSVWRWLWRWLSRCQP